jgi:hypothetical protein
MLKKKIWASFQRIIELFTQKFVTKLSKIWVWDLGSEKTYSGFRIPDPGPGVKKAPDPGSATLKATQNDRRSRINHSDYKTLEVNARHYPCRFQLTYSNHIETLVNIFVF